MLLVISYIFTIEGNKGTKCRFQWYDTKNIGVFGWNLSIFCLQIIFQSLCWRRPCHFPSLTHRFTHDTTATAAVAAASTTIVTTYQNTVELVIIPFKVMFFSLSFMLICVFFVQHWLSTARAGGSFLGAALSLTLLHVYTATGYNKNKIKPFKILM